jgi:hypothetical protein
MYVFAVSSKRGLCPFGKQGKTELAAADVDRYNQSFGILILIQF